MHLAYEPTPALYIHRPPPPWAPLQTAARLAAAAAQGHRWARPHAWQREAIWRCMHPDAHGGVVVAIMGAGKSVAMSLTVAAWTGPALVVAPTIRLCQQLAGTLEEVLGYEVGQSHTHADRILPVTVACLPSAADALARMPDGPLLLVVDECHRAEQAPWLDDPRVCHRIGYTATAYRASGGLVRWTHQIMRYGIEQALSDGVLLEPVVDLHRQGSEDIDADCIEWVRARTGPGVVSAGDILDAEAFADALRNGGIPAEAIHSRMSQRAQAEVVRRLQSGDLRALVHVRMLVEGVDLPWLQWLALRTPRGSRVAYAQEIGRVMRQYPGKARPDVWDPHRVTVTYSLQGPAELGAALEGPSTPSAPSEPVEPIIDPATGEELPQRTERQAARSRAIADTAVYIMQAARALTWAGIAQPTHATVRQWRSEPVSEAQVAYLGKLAKVARAILHYESPARGTHIRAVCRMMLRAQAPALAGRSRKGYASDLLTVWRAVCAPDDAERAAADVALTTRDIAIPEDIA
jgi:hypothetical protein